MNVKIQYKQSRQRDSGGQFTQVYPFDKTKLNGKFLFEIDKDDAEYAAEYSRLRSAAYAYSKRTNRKFQCRQVDGGIQVRRIA